MPLKLKNGRPKKFFIHLLKYYFFSKEASAFIILSIFCVLALFRHVDLTPHVDDEFFFSSDDLHFQADNQISKLFARKDTQLIVSVEGNIFSKQYQDKIRHLCGLLITIDGVTAVKSITHGPRSIFEATRSPFWKRLLISPDNKASNVIAVVKSSGGTQMIRDIENLCSSLQSRDFNLKISGFPYVTELIRRNLEVDFKTFTTLAFFLFGIVVVFIFHSWRVFTGMIVSCLLAASLTFLVTHLLDLKIGILTANLATIIFVLTLSHIIFLTFNWQNIRKHELSPAVSVAEAVEITRWASFWCMLTNLLGFLSLLFVPAKPLSELGIAGSIGAAVSFIVVYAVFPSFLRLKEKSPTNPDHFMQRFYDRSFLITNKFHTLIIFIIMGSVALTLPKLWELNTDPSLLSYFAEKSEIREGLEYIDRNGGSSPLVIVVKTQSGELFNTEKAYKNLWRLQNALERHPSVGSIISLPALMAEGKRSPLSLFLVWDWFFEILEDPKYDSIAESFITKDRKYGLFLIRMKETNRTKSRLETIQELKDILVENEFVPHLIGGIYALQGRLSNLVAESLIYSLGQLILIFAIIAFIFGRSLRISIAMTVSIAIIPLCILGIIGQFGIPLDTISAPAANVALGIGIDSMIHMVNIFHRSRRQDESNAQAWEHVTRRMWQPIITSTIIICTGFGIFFSSSFPPTQRFGGAIVLGSIVAAFTSLFIFPLIAKHKSN